MLNKFIIQLNSIILQAIDSYKAIKDQEDTNKEAAK